MTDPERPQHHFKPFRGSPGEDDIDDNPVPPTVTAVHDDPAAPSEDIPGLLPAWAETTDDEYADFEAEIKRIETLFADPSFRAAEAQRRADRKLQPARRTSANGSVGRAVALGFANVFDPDRVKDDIVYVQERGDGDGDLPETTIDPDDPKHTRIVFKRKRKKP